MNDHPQRLCHDSNASTRIRHRNPVLVVLHSDGYVQVYAGSDVDAHVAVMPAVPTVPTVPAAEGERLADEYLSQALPRRFRSVYWPGMIRATGLVETILPSDIARRDLMVRVIRALTTLTADESEVVTWTL